MKSAVPQKPIFSVFHAGVEPELAGGGPRPIRRTRRSGEHPVVKGLMLLFILPGFGALIRAVLMSFALWFGAWVPGTVDDRNVNKDDEGTSYSIQFSYSVGTQQFSSGASLDSSSCRAVPDDAPLRVRVWLPLPEWSAVAFWNGRALGPSRATLLFGSLFWIGVCSIPLYSGFLKSMEDRALVRRGTPIVGRITRKEAKDDDPMTCHLHYEFPDREAPFEGGMHKGAVKVRSDEFEEVAEGESLTVLFDSKHPEINTLYRFAHYRAK